MAGYIVAPWASENKAGNIKNKASRPVRKEHDRAISISLRNKPLGHQWQRKQSINKGTGKKNDKKIV